MLRIFTLMLSIVLFLSSCYAKTSNLSHTPSLNSNDVCNHSNVYENMVCFDKLNEKLKDELEQLGNSKENDYLSWVNNIKRNCENPKLAADEIPQGEGLGLIKSICYYDEYDKRLQKLSDKSKSQKNNSASTEDDNNQKLPIPITFKEMMVLLPHHESYEPRKLYKKYWIELDQNTKDMIETSGCTTNQDTILILPTHSGSAWLMYDVQEGGSLVWYLFSQHETPYTCLNLGLDSTFRIDQSLKITVSGYFNDKGKIETHHYQVEQNGSARQID